jgi:dienelactone hydrolase
MRLCLYAFSYGGPHLAAAIREQPAYLRCLVASSAVFGVRGDSSPLMSPTAALRDVERLRIPVFVARAGRDAAWINGLAEAFIQEAVRKNVQLELHNYASGLHAFDMRNDTDESRAIITASFTFVRRHLMENVR